MSEDVVNIIKNTQEWQAPKVPKQILCGDMPGDKVEIWNGHIESANLLFPRILEELLPVFETNPKQRAVLAVCGGSGVGKSGVASLLSFYFCQLGIESYTLSGDNYPHRIPVYNDAERLRIFRESALKKMIADHVYSKERFAVVHELQKNGMDADPSNVKKYDWYTSYLKGGREGLKRYLGTENEQGFQEVEDIITQFKNGAEEIWLKRMGRADTELWYENVDFSATKILIIEWTHGNSDKFKGVDIPILLNSTPEETLAHRLARNRDGAADSPFTTMVLEIEQGLLKAQAGKAKIILSKSGELLTYEEYTKRMEESEKGSKDSGPMLNAYPDSMGGTLTEVAEFLKRPEVKGAFSSFYILPSLFHTDLDRGFSVIDYTLNDSLASREDLILIQESGIDLKLDFILNHASVLSKQFQDILKNGEQSKYKDFFIDWNQFWEGLGTMTKEGYIEPDPKWIGKMFFRKPGLPILMVRFPDGRDVPYWNTFYREVKYPRLDAQDIMDAAEIKYPSAVCLAEALNESLENGKKPREACEELGAFGKTASAAKLTAKQIDAIVAMLESRRKYLGQMDLNIKSPLVWEFYDETLRNLSEYGASIVRLDAFAYAPKEPGEKNFLNEPGTWEVLEKIRKLADCRGITLLPEIHAGYEEGIYEKIAQKGYLTYDFFLPGLLIDALERGSGKVLAAWARELCEKNIRAVNMLGCHDGIPLLDLKGLVPDERIQSIIDTVKARGGHVKDLHGQKNVYYQVNATYYSALGEDDRKMLLARAIQLFMPGKPQIWYLDLFAGKNDIAAVERAGTGGHKEINRTNLTAAFIEEGMKKEVVKEQLKMLRFRGECKAFGFDSALTVESEGARLTFEWEKKGHTASLTADLKKLTFSIKETDSNGERTVMSR